MNRPLVTRNAWTPNCRPPEAHDRDCDQPGWLVDPRLPGARAVLARCRGCGAVQHRPLTDPAAA